MATHVYSRENVRKVAEEELRQIQEMFEWLGTRGAGDVTRDEFERLKGYVLMLASERYNYPTRYMKYMERPAVALYTWVENEQSQQYRAHFDQIAELLPPQLLSYAREVSLHDGRLHKFDVDETTGKIDIQVNVPIPLPPNDLNQKDSEIAPDLEDKTICFDLHYEGAQVIGGVTDELVRVVNAPDAEVLDEEVDVVEESLFEHRLLLWPKGDFAIRFSGFSFAQDEITEPSPE